MIDVGIKLAQFVGSTIINVESEPGYDDKLRFTVQNAAGLHYITIKPDKHLLNKMQVTTHMIKKWRTTPEEPLA